MSQTEVEYDVETQLGADGLPTDLDDRLLDALINMCYPETTTLGVLEPQFRDALNHPVIQPRVIEVIELLRRAGDYALEPAILGDRSLSLTYRHDPIAGIQPALASVESSLEWISSVEAALDSVKYSLRSRAHVLFGGEEHSPTSYRYLQGRTAESSLHPIPVADPRPAESTIVATGDGDLLMRVPVRVAFNSGEVAYLKIRMDGSAYPLQTRAFDEYWKMKRVVNLVWKIKSLAKHADIQIAALNLTFDDLKEHFTNSKARREVDISTGFTGPKGYKPRVVVRHEATIRSEKVRLIFSGTVNSFSGDVLRLEADFMITIIPLLPATATVMYTDKPMYDDPKGLLTEIGPNGSRDLEDLAKKMLSGDQWLNLNLGGTVGRDAFNIKVRDSATKGGLEIEDVERFQSRTKARALLRHLFYDVIIGMSGYGELLLHSESRGVVRERLERAIENRLTPSVTHGGVVRVPPGNDVPDNLAAETVVNRIMLSRLCRVNSRSNNLPVHLWSSQDLRVMKVPISLTTSSFLMYTLDPWLTKLLEDSGIRTMGDCNVKRMYGLASKGIIGQSPAGVRVLDEIMAAPVSMTHSRSRYTHTVFLCSGEEVSLDPIIGEMMRSIQRMTDATRAGVANDGAIVWHPDFAIIVFSSGRMPSVPEWQVVVAPGPRVSRFVGAYKNAIEAVKGIDGEMNIKQHFGQLFRDAGYAGALQAYMDK